MKKRSFCSVILLLCMLLFAGTMTASAKTVSVVLDVKGGTDITKKMQSALDKAKKKKANTYYEITVPAGTYKISGILKIYSNTTLNMEGVTLTRQKSGNVMLRFGGTKKYKGYSQCKNITLNGGVWDGNGKSADIMRFAHGQNLRFNQVTLRNPKTSHHIEIAACKDVTFSQCVFEGFTGNLKARNDHEALQIDIMRKEHFDYYPAYDETVSRNITVEGCTFRDLQRGMGSHSSIVGSNFYNINILNNTFENITGYAIIGMNYIDSKINNNTITNCGLGIRLRTVGTSSPYKSNKKKVAHRSNWNTEILNNKISITNTGFPNQASGIALYGGTVTKKGIAGDYRISNVTVAGNEIYQDCFGILVTLRDVDSCVVKDNKLICNFIKPGYTSDACAFIRVEHGVRNQIIGNDLDLQVLNDYTQKIAGIRLTTGANETVVSGNKIDEKSHKKVQEISSKNNMIADQ